MSETISTFVQDWLARAVTLVRQPLCANVGYLMAVNLVNSLGGGVCWGLAAHLCQPGDVGMASATLSAVVLISSVAGLGVDTGLVHFLPKARFPHRLLNTAFTLVAAVALLVSGVFLAGLGLWSPSLLPLRQNGSYVVGFIVAATTATLIAVTRMAFVACRRAIYALVQTCVINGGRLLLVAALADLGAVGIVGSVTAAVVLAVALSLLGLLPRAEKGYRPHLGLSRPDLDVLLPYSMGNYVADWLTQSVQMLLPLMTLEILGPAFSGYAYIAWMIGSLVASPGVAAAGSAFAEASNSPHRLADILAGATALGLLLTLPPALVLVATAPRFLLLFGPAYAQEACGLLRWLAAAAPLTMLTRLYFTRLRAQRRIGHLVLLSSAITAATLGAAVAFIPRLGIAAGGIGWLTGNSLVAAIAIGTTWRELSRDGKRVQPIRGAVTALRTLTGSSEPVEGGGAGR
jgi:O-antigen/teichoic acid export membrane protein